MTEYDANKHIALEKSESYREGEAHGRTEGESRFAALTLKLLEEGKTQELQRAARDEQLRQALYQQYGI